MNEQAWEQLLDEYNGVITSAEAVAHGFSRMDIKRQYEAGKLDQVRRGIYVRPDVYLDEMTVLSLDYPAAIFSHSTALYLLGLSDRTPLTYIMTVARTDNAAQLLKEPLVSVRRCARKDVRYEVLTVSSPTGFSLRTYGAERSLIDLLTDRHHSDRQLFVDALRRYMQGEAIMATAMKTEPTKNAASTKIAANVTALMQVARHFGAEDQIRPYLEVLL